MSKPCFAETKIEGQTEPAVPTKVCATAVGVSVTGLLKMAEHGIAPCLRVGVRGRGLRFVISEVREALRARPPWSQSRQEKDNDGM